MEDKKIKFDSNLNDITLFLKEIKDSNLKITDLVIEKDNYLYTIIIKTSNK